MLGQPGRRAMALVLTAIVAGGAVEVARSVTERDPPRAVRPPAPAEQTHPAAASPRPPVPVTSSPRTAASPSAIAPPHPSCTTVSRAFSLRTVAVPGVTRGARVLTPARDANGVPGVPPLTTAGKSVFAWDREKGSRPGDPRGNVLLNAHTWPDGSALGNRLLAGLQRGDQIIAMGEGGARLCYRVTERVEVPAERPMPRYYTSDGPPQIAIVVCSGRRLGPGNWEKRTVWFAAPSA